MDETPNILESKPLSQSTGMEGEEREDGREGRRDKVGMSNAREHENSVNNSKATTQNYLRFAPQIILIGRNPNNLTKKMLE